MTGNRPRSSFLKSDRMQLVVQAVADAIGSGNGVLICGEPGTGRETLARAIHRASAMPGRYSIEDLLRFTRSALPDTTPFVVLDCAATRDIERQLFGAPAATNGSGETDHISCEALLYQAFGGTLFIGSVQDMPARVQARLARVLRDREVWVEGRPAPPAVERVDVRVIASIDCPCHEEGDDRLVPELRKKLVAHQIDVPPLRGRREDIAALVRMLLAEICDTLKIPGKAMSSQALALLAALPWRGNFTELRGLLRTLVLKSPGRLIRLADVLDHIRLDGGSSSSMAGGTLKEARDRFEREYVAAVLEQHHGRMAEAARALGIQRTNLYRKVRQLSVARKRPGVR